MTNFKKMIYSVPPKVSARIIALILAIITASLCLRIGYSISGDDEQNVDNSNQTENMQVVEDNTTFSREGALSIGSVIGAGGATVCSLSESKIIAQKTLDSPIIIGDAVVLITALLTSKAISDGRISLNDEAVCPASAAKSPSYGVSSQILPIGRRMQINDILKCMLFQSGSAFAITLAVHISGSEQAFADEMNLYLASLGITGTVSDCCGDTESILTPYQLSLVIKNFYADPLLCTIINSNEPITVMHGSGVETVIKNDFFVSVCTPAQAQNDGIRGGRIGKNGFGFVIFMKEEKEYLVTVMQSANAFSDILMLYSAYVLS